VDPLQDKMEGNEEAYELATEWLLRLSSPDVARADLQGWLEWLNRTDDNRVAFETMQEIYHRFAFMPAPLKQELQLASVGRSMGPKTARTAWASRRALIAAAAVLVTTAGAAWWVGHNAMRAETIQAPAEHSMTLRLADGSTAVIGADAMISVEYTKDVRGLNVMRGETYFEVQHDATRPFVVRAGDVQIKAVGTAFNVTRASDAVSVTVTRGVVEVTTMRSAGEPGGGLRRRYSVRVASGQKITLATDEKINNGFSLVSVENVEWRNGRAVFVGAPLSRVIALINKTGDVRIVINDPRVAELDYSGTILASRINEWIAALPKIYPIDIVKLDDGTLDLVFAHR